MTWLRTYRTEPGRCGSIDLNRGDPQNSWDTDQFPNDVREIATALYYLHQGGGFTTGGNNFDSKVRRQSIDPVDLFHGHIGAVDVLARGLLGAARLIAGGELDAFRDQRYAGWQGAVGLSILSGTTSLADLADGAVKDAVNPVGKSGRQEYLENVISRAI